MDSGEEAKSQRQNLQNSVAQMLRNTSVLLTGIMRWRNKMSIISLASRASVGRGYEYYNKGNVILHTKLSDHEFKAKVKGNGRCYDVHIDIEHPRKSKCNCPHAEGTRRICKHMIALYFTIFPDEAEKYFSEVVEYEIEEQERQQEIEDGIMEYIYSLTKQELRDELCELLFNSPQWVIERFMYEKLEW